MHNNVLLKYLKICSALCALAILAVSSAALLREWLRTEASVSVFAESDETSVFSSLTPYVIDGQTKLPIDNAVVVIPEFSETHYTRADGKTDVIRLPYLEHSSEILKKDWQEITLLVYADGYAPYALFYLRLSADTHRQGPTVMLFPDRGKVFSIIEGPPENWAEKLLKKYQP